MTFAVVRSAARPARVLGHRADEHCRGSRCGPPPRRSSTPAPCATPSPCLPGTDLVVRRARRGAVQGRGRRPWCRARTRPSRRTVPVAAAATADAAASPPPHAASPLPPARRRGRHRAGDRSRGACRRSRPSGTCPPRPRWPSPSCCGQPALRPRPILKVQVLGADVGRAAIRCCRAWRRCPRERRLARRGKEAEGLPEHAPHARDQGAGPVLPGPGLLVPGPCRAMRSSSSSGARTCFPASPARGRTPAWRARSRS